MELQVVVRSKNDLGEGPVWSQHENALYWVDISEKKLQRWSFERGSIEDWKFHAEVSSLSLRQSGGCLITLRDEIALFDFSSGRLTSLCKVEADMPSTRFNDGKCDRQGRFWAGTMDESPDDNFSNLRASLYRLGHDQKCVTVRKNVGISNGLGWSPDNKLFYYTDSAVQTIYAYDFDPETGQISGEMIFFKSPKGYTPDGMTVDSEGYIWCAMWDGWKVVRFTPGGEIDLEVPMPVQRPTSCTFGGENLSQLFITSARIGLSVEALSKQPEAGNVFMLETETTGLPEAQYLG